MKGTSSRAVAAVASVAPTVLGTAAFYFVLTWLRVGQHNVLWFVHLGRAYLQAAHDPAFSGLAPQSDTGYDGQYYFALAADPLHAHATMSGGNAGYLYSRPFYPLLARVLAGGSVVHIPSTMLELNLAAIVLGTLAVALWLRRHGLSPLFAFLYGLWPGLVFCVFRDLTEPLAFGLTATAVLVFDPASRRRLAGAAALFALALLTRETVVPFVVACGAALVLADRPAPGSGARAWLAPGTWRRGATLLAASGLPLVLWRIGVSAWLHQPTQEQGSGSAWLVPFHGLATYWPFDAQHWLIATTVVLPSVGAALAVARPRVLRAQPVAAGLLIANVLLVVVFLPDLVDVDFAAASRAAAGVVLAAIYALPALAAAGVARRWLVAGSFLLSLGFYLVVEAALGLPPLELITT